MMNVLSTSLSLLNDAVKLDHSQGRASNIIRRGSLPFKKRHFPNLCSSEDSASCDSSRVMVEKEESNGPSVMKPTTNTEGDEKIAALALVAAAASEVPSDLLEGEGNSPNQRHMFSLPEDDCNHNTSNPDAPALSSVLVAAAADLQSLQAARLNSSSSSSSSSSGSSSHLGTVPKTKRIHRPPLDTPLPNGCHGRTSRNNSYCRRQPCYKGSKYCKLHYQHYVVTGGRDPVMDDLASEGEEEGNETARSGGNDGDKPVEVSNSEAQNSKGPQPSPHQDKRYMGDPNEMRCLATTTRGRECAYCAVNDTKYCYLHADYDTNPPPRRGGTSKTKTAPETTRTPTGPPSVSSEDSSSIPEKKANADNTKRKSISASARRASTSKNMEKHMADAPFPLLSVLSTDKWLNRKVIVSTGPLVNHVGHVEKWGNGWVSVRLPGVGLHNRRSFELYLHPNQGPTGDIHGSPKMSDDAQKETPHVELFESHKISARKDEQELRRCISRDIDTPPAPVVNAKKIRNNIHEVTPLTSRKVIGIDQSTSGKEDTQRVNNIMFPIMHSAKPATVPESPLPPMRPNSSGFVKDGNGVRLGGDERSVSDQDPGENSAPSAKFQLPVKMDPRDQKDEMPLMDLLSQKGNNKLGLLFGTAALERSRRSVHKPARYEPERSSPKKRDRAGDDHMDQSGNASKRKHIEEVLSKGANLPLVSSSDEESAGITAADSIAV